MRIKPLKGETHERHHLKTVERRREEEVAERLGKPASDTVVGGVGPVGETRETGEPRRATGADVDSLPLMR